MDDEDSQGRASGQDAPSSSKQNGRRANGNAKPMKNSAKRNKERANRQAEYDDAQDGRLESAFGDEMASRTGSAAHRDAQLRLEAEHERALRIQKSAIATELVTLQAEAASGAQHHGGRIAEL